MQFQARAVATRLLVGLVVVNAFVYGLAGFALLESRGRYLDEAVVTRQNLAHSLSANVSASMDRMDVGLSSIVMQVEQELALGRVNETFLNAYVSRQKALVRDFESIWVVDANGDARWGSDLPPGGPVNVADREYFQLAKAESGTGLIVGKPQVGRVTGTWSVIVARRINRPDGSFAGIAAGSIAVVDYFARMFANIDVGRLGLVTVRSTDMTSYARYAGMTTDTTELGSKTISPLALKAIEARPQGGAYTAKSPVDGVERDFRYQKVARYPFYVFVGQSREEALAFWRDEAAMAAALLAFFTLATCFYARSSYKRARQTFEAQEAERTSASDELERLQKILDSAPLAIAFYEGRRVMFANPKVTETFGVKVGDTVAGMYVDPDARQAIAAELEAGEVVTREMRVYDKNRDIRHMLVTYVPTRIGGVKGVLSWVVDITGRKEAEEAIRQAKDAALAATIAKSDFLANMSHEIRTPLNAIVGLTHLMRRDGVPPAQAARLQQIERSGDHLLALVNDILDLSKVEAGRLTLDDTAFVLGALVGEVDSMIRPQAIAKGLELRSEPRDSTLVLRGDPMRLRQALLNYMSNAVKFTAAGTVSLNCRIVEETPRDALLRFEVSDSGIGIPAGKLEKLFTPFEQVDASTSRKFGGTGLGLAITRHFAQLMGGSVEAASVEGQGSTFSLTVRLAKSDEETRAAQAASEATANSVRERYAGARILLAEDNPVSAEVTLDFLRDTGLVVDHAQDGAQAVELAAKDDYELALMDMQMPGMDGLEATRRIREMPAWRGKPIVALTANVFAEDRQRCAEAGMDDFLPKPMRPAHLYGMLLKWLPREHASSGAAAAAAGQPAPPADVPVDAFERFARAPGLDPERVLDFRSQPGKYLRMLDMLLRTHEQELPKLEQHLRQGDLQAARAIAHSVRGAAAMLGAVGLESSAGQLEDALRGGDAAGAELALAAAKRSFEELSTAVDAMREASPQE